MIDLIRWLVNWFSGYTKNQQHGGYSFEMIRILVLNIPLRQSVQDGHRHSPIAPYWTEDEDRGFIPAGHQMPIVVWQSLDRIDPHELKLSSAELTSVKGQQRALIVARRRKRRACRPDDELAFGA